MWYDFLLSLEQDFPKQERDPAWDMTTRIYPSSLSPRYVFDDYDENGEDEDSQKNSKKPRPVWLPNWYDACAIMISHGARDLMHRLDLSQSITGPDYSNVYATNSISEVFSPDQARALRQRYRAMDPPATPSFWSRIFPFKG